MTLPRLLVIDDLAGWSLSDRATMCRDLALRDVTSGGSSVDSDSPYLAEAVFVPGLVRAGNEVSGGPPAVEATLAAVAQGWERQDGLPWALVLLDLQFDCGAVSDGAIDPDQNWPRRADREHGLRLLDAMRTRWPDPENSAYTALPVATLSRRPRGDLEGRLNSIGNRGYIERGAASPAEQRAELAKLLFSWGLLPDGDVPALASDGRPDPKRRESKIIGRSGALLRALRKARQAAASNAPCLLLGEPGVGKEEFSRYICAMSARSAGPFVAVNCAAIPKDLIESELFGYVRGAFTGADTRGKAGQFETADGGTIFLDEIGETSLQAQSKMLRVLQEKEIVRVGDTRTRNVDVRILAATNRDLREAARAHEFREDLLGRLGGLENAIRVPPLRERGRDVEVLFLRFLEAETTQIGGLAKSIEPEVFERLSMRRWASNNVRDLQSLVHKLAGARKHSAVVVGEDIPDESAVSVQPGPPATALPPPPPPDPHVHLDADALDTLASWHEARQAHFPADIRELPRLRGKGTRVVGGAAAAVLSFLELSVIASGRSTPGIWRFFSGDDSCKDTDTARTRIAPLFLIDAEVSLAALRRSDDLLWLAQDVGKNKRRSASVLRLVTRLKEETGETERLARVRDGGEA